MTAQRQANIALQSGGCEKTFRTAMASNCVRRFDGLFLLPPQVLLFGRFRYFHVEGVCEQLVMLQPRRLSIASPPVASGVLVSCKVPILHGALPYGLISIVLYLHLSRFFNLFSPRGGSPKHRLPSCMPSCSATGFFVGRLPDRELGCFWVPYSAQFLVTLHVTEILVSNCISPRTCKGQTQVGFIATTQALIGLASAECSIVPANLNCEPASTTNSPPTLFIDA